MKRLMSPRLTRVLKTDIFIQGYVSTKALRHGSSKIFFIAATEKIQMKRISGSYRAWEGRGCSLSTTSLQIFNAIQRTPPTLSSFLNGVGSRRPSYARSSTSTAFKQSKRQSTELSTTFFFTKYKWRSAQQHTVAVVVVNAVLLKYILHAAHRFEFVMKPKTIRFQNQELVAALIQRENDGRRALHIHVKCYLRAYAFENLNWKATHQLQQKIHQLGKFRKVSPRIFACVSPLDPATH